MFRWLSLCLCQIQVTPLSDVVKGVRMCLPVRIVCFDLQDL